ncbi:MAG: dTDP-4-dehydrorhamnose reductase [Gammaproteobacteria bacterium]
MTGYLPKVLITGGQGQLSMALQHHSQAMSVHLIACSREQLDITQQISIEQAIAEYQPDIIINTAAYTAVDKAEQDHEAALHINKSGPYWLGKICQANKIPLLHVSTDYVFDGQQTTPYQEDDETNPINYYGKTKLLGEQAIRETCEQHIILRVSSVFSEYGQNFLKTILRLASEREELRVVADQIACPTYAGHIASAIYQIIKDFKAPGTYHYCDQPAVTWHAFATAIIEEAAKHQTLAVKRIIPITTADYPTPAKRPHYSVLNCSRTQHVFAIEQADWRTTLPGILNSLKGKQS